MLDYEAFSLGFFNNGSAAVAPRRIGTPLLNITLSVWANTATTSFITHDDEDLDYPVLKSMSTKTTDMVVYTSFVVSPHVALLLLYV